MMILILQDNTWWIKELFLYESDRATLLNDVELSDAVIHAAQRLLKTQYPLHTHTYLHRLVGSRNWPELETLTVKRTL